MYFSNYKSAGITTAYICALPCLILLYSKWFYGTISPQRLPVISWLPIALLCALLWIKGLNDPKFCLYAISTLCASLCLLHPNEKSLQQVALIIIISLYLLPFGSDLGIGNMGAHCLWIAAPFSIGTISAYVNVRQHPAARVAWASLCTYLVLMTTAIWAQRMKDACFFDHGSRFEKTHLIKADLATTFTTEKNCRMLDPMLSELSHYVAPGDELFCFQSITTVHYLTQTRPYLKNPWPWSYPPSLVRQKIEQAENDHGALPVIVRDKSKLPNWQTYYPDWNNDHAQETYAHKNKRITYMNEFTSRHNYRVVWENEVFQILLPPTMGDTAQSRPMSCL